ncbi:hypothetical protein Q5P01_011523 [Channa striata]|uniref:Uncharacterized protein n=1 Tax=Channa striata TaxID=64152 RepID=A0AA88MUG7_CHASR|nr:hypothetical protein Q5P01_011523 [Channa striata]
MTQNPAATSSSPRLRLTRVFAGAASIVGQLAYIQQHQNIVRTTLCAPSTLLSKLTFKSKMESSPPLSSSASPSSCPLGNLRLYIKLLAAKIDTEPLSSSAVCHLWSENKRSNTRKWRFTAAGVAKQLLPVDRPAPLKKDIQCLMWTYTSTTSTSLHHV